MNYIIRSQGCFSTYSPRKPAGTNLLAAHFRRVLDSLVASEQPIRKKNRSKTKTFAKCQVNFRYYLSMICCLCHDDTY